MIQTISVNPPDHLRSYTEVTISSGGPLAGLPFLSIDRDSYIVQAEVQSGINFRPDSGRHCIAIGKGCSLADGITLMIDLNHDYKSVSQGSLHFMQGVGCADKIARKGSIIIQNDVWVGHGATIMPGITLHNGCVVAAEAVVTKDVPPYAIVGGNPARILRYRFDAGVIEALQKIAWWDWPEEIQTAYREDFSLPVEAFVKKHLPHEDNADRFAPPRVQPKENPLCCFRWTSGTRFRFIRKYWTLILRKTVPRRSCCSICPKTVPMRKMFAA